MDPDLAPDDGPLRQLAPAARVRWRVTRSIAGLMPAIAVGAVLAVLVGAEAVPASVLAVPAVLAVLGVIAGIWTAGVRYRRFGYRLGEDVLRVRDGVLFHSDATVPLFRVQHVDLGRGPLQLAFGLTTLVVHTAAPAADVTLPDVSADDAEQLRDQILAAARRAAAELGTVDVDAV